MNHNLLRISSDFKTASSASNSDFQVAFNNVSLLQGITRCVMKSADLPNVFYNVNSIGYNFAGIGNNRLLWRDSSGQTNSFVYTPGQYTLQEVLDAFNTHISAQYNPPGSVNLSIDPITSHIVLNNTSMFGQSIGIYPESFVNAFGFNSTISPYLGIIGTEFAWLPTDGRQALGLSNMAGIQEVYVTSQKISDSSNMVVAANTMYPVILNIQVDKPFGEFVHYASQHPEIDDIEYPSLTQGTNLQLVDIQLRDRWGHILDLQGLPFNLIVKCYHQSP